MELIAELRAVESMWLDWRRAERTGLLHLHVQVLDGLSGATLGVLTALVIADLSKGTGRFNLAQGLVGTIAGIGAALSTSASGIVVTRYGPMAGFLSITVVGLLALAILWIFMPETKPDAPRARPEPIAAPAE